MEALLHATLRTAAALLELAAMAVILGGGVAAFARLAATRSLAPARHVLSHALLLGLDFTIGADVLKVAAAPQLEQVATIALVVAVRIALTLALLRELRDERKRPSEADRA